MAFQGFNPIRQSYAEPLSAELQYVINNITMDVLHGSTLTEDLHARIRQVLQASDAGRLDNAFAAIYAHRGYSRGQASMIDIDTVPPLTFPSEIFWQPLTAQQQYVIDSLLDGWARERLRQELTTRNHTEDLMHALRHHPVLLHEFVATLYLPSLPLTLQTRPTAPQPQYRSNDGRDDGPTISGTILHHFSQDNLLTDDSFEQYLHNCPSQNSSEDVTDEDQTGSDGDIEAESPVDAAIIPFTAASPSEKRRWYCECGCSCVGWKDHHNHLSKQHGRSDRYSGEVQAKNNYLTATEAIAKGFTKEECIRRRKETKDKRNQMQKDAAQWKRKKNIMTPEAYERLAQQEDGYHDFDKQWVGRYMTKEQRKKAKKGDEKKDKKKRK